VFQYVGDSYNSYRESQILTTMASIKRAIFETILSRTKINKDKMGSKEETMVM